MRDALGKRALRAAVLVPIMPGLILVGASREPVTRQAGLSPARAAGTTPPDVALRLGRAVPLGTASIKTQVLPKAPVLPTDRVVIEATREAKEGRRRHPRQPVEVLGLGLAQERRQAKEASYVTGLAGLALVAITLARR